MLKRALDLAAAFSLLIVLVVPMLVVAALIVARMGSPVLFRQMRPGLHGRPFEVLKFRTMTDASDEHGKPLPDGARLTALGRRLRRFSIDEWPQLVNVLRGDMSLVGPRPLLMEYLPLYNARQARRHEVFPGITGWAQINGRNAVSWQERFELDVWYVEHRSLALDLKILLLTAWRMFQARGINEPGRPTMTNFTGNPGNAERG